jgi:hypothetical protein
MGITLAMEAYASEKQQTSMEIQFFATMILLPLMVAPHDSLIMY